MQARVLIEGEITSGVTKSELERSINALGSIDSLLVDINSGGGDVDEGYLIYSYLKGLGIPIHTRVTGICASIATVILLAGSKRTAISSNLNLMIHNPWVDLNEPMEAKEVEAVYNYILAEENKLIEFYVDNLKIDKNVLVELMDAESRLSHEKAKSLGFLTDEEVEYKAVAQIKYDNMNDKHTNILNSIKALLGVSAEEIEVKGLDLILSDDTTFYVETDSDELEQKSIYVEKGGEVVTDGEYSLKDGRVLTVFEGKIVTVTEQVEEPNEMDALRTENQSLKDELEELKTSSKASLDEVNAANAAILLEISEKVKDLEEENKAMASITLGGNEKVKAQVKQSSANTHQTMESWLREMSARK